MTQFTYLDIEKNVQYISTLNEILIIHKWSRKYTKAHSITKHVPKVSNDVTLILNLVCLKLHCL